MKRKKLTKASLDELAKTMPVLNETTQKALIGGGDGTWNSPYTYEQYQALVNSGSQQNCFYYGTDGVICSSSSLDTVTCTAADFKHVSGTASSLHDNIDVTLLINNGELRNLIANVWGASGSNSGTVAQHTMDDFNERLRDAISSEIYRLTDNDIINGDDQIRVDFNEKTGMIFILNSAGETIASRNIYTN